MPSRINHVPRDSHPLTSSSARFARSGADPSFLTLLALGFVEYMHGANLESEVGLPETTST